jgi:hypothetical protein
MTDEQTLVLYSGHPMGLFPSHKKAPRVVVTNGMMIPNYSKPDDWENATGIGFHVGGFVNYAINEKLSIRPELLFSSRGTRISSSSEILGINFDIESTSTYNFVEVPILIGIGGETGLQVHVGPSVNLLLGGRAKTEVTTSIGGTSETETEEVTGSKFTEGMRGLDLGVVLGAGFNLESGLGFGARYQRGLTSINEEDTDQFVSNWNLVQVYLSYTLGK